MSDWRSTVEELVELAYSAKMARETYSEAIEAQAKTLEMPKAALRKYVAARVQDKLQDLSDETEAVAKLLLGEDA